MHYTLNQTVIIVSEINYMTTPKSGVFILRRCMLAALALAVGIAGASQAMAWGATGHRLIGVAAMQTLPPEMPDFLRDPDEATTVGELSREPDRWKGTGRVHDNERDGAHYLDLGDDGLVSGGPALSALPATRELYDAALRAVGTDSWKAGWLPYSIVDGWEQLAKDFGYLRVDAWAATSDPDTAHRAWFAADLAERKQLILRDIGTLSHYVGDGSQPLHVSIHHDNWGAYPNPENFTQGRFHAAFEGAFVHGNVAQTDVTGAVGPLGDCHCEMMKGVTAYLAATNAQVAPLYRLHQQLAFATSDPRGRAFAIARLAAGATELRDLIALAWRMSPNVSVGYPAASAADIIAKAADPYDIFYGSD